MQSVRKRRSVPTGSAKGVRNSPVSEENVSPIDHGVAFYTIPPTFDLNLAQFEALAIERLGVLKDIEELKMRDVRGGEFSTSLDRKLGACSMVTSAASDFGPADAESLLESRRRDWASHFILRLAYCGTDDLRRWFLQQEVHLFRHRLSQAFRSREALPDVVACLEAHGIRFDPLGKEEYDSAKADLAKVQCASRPHGKEPVAGEERAAVEAFDREGGHAAFYRIPFEEALELVRSRRALLRGGDAYVHRSSLIPVIVARFRAHLSLALVHTWKECGALIDDERLRPVLRSLPRGANAFSAGAGAAGAVGELHPSRIDEAAQTSFPLCMRVMHESLRRDHHLKYGGRVTFGLFLKGAGLSLENALAFWKSEFTRVMPGEKFEKEYAYNIRFNYGKEGKRTNYSPWGCTKIIAANPGQGEHHGCPYKTHDGDRLRALLARAGVPTAGVAEITGLAGAQHYQLACRRAFELLHPGAAAERAGQHPNSYYEESVAYHAARGGQVGQAGQGQPDKPDKETVEARAQLHMG